jgi:hypothetical protein
VYRGICKKDEKTGEVCGFGISRIVEAYSCGKEDQTTCSSKSMCQWSTGLSTCVYIAPKKGFLPCTGCGHDLFLQIADLTMPVKDAWQARALLDNVYCANINKETNCYDAYSTYVLGTSPLDISMLDSRSTFETICTSATLRPCLQVLYQGTASFELAQLQISYLECVNPQRTTDAKQSCFDTFIDGTQGILRRQALIGGYCATHDQTPRGTYCAMLAYQIWSDPCFQTAVTSQTCSAECDTSINATVGNAKCCGYHVQQILSPVLPTAQLAPMVPNFKPTLPQQERQNFFATLKVCPLLSTVKEDQLKMLTQKCTGIAPGKQPPKKNLGLKLRWSALKNNQTLYDLMVRAMTSDTAQMLGLSTDNIQNPKLTEDTNRKIEGTRRQAASSATNFQYEIVTETPEDQERAEKTADEKEKSDDVQLPNTQSAVQTSCSDTCISSSSSSSSLFSSASVSEFFRLGGDASKTVATVALIAAAALAFLA